MKRHATCLILFLVCWANAAKAEPLTPFTGMPPGEVAAPWQLKTIRGKPPAEFRIIDDKGIVEAVASSSVASLFHPTQIDPVVTPYLSWRWRIIDAVAGSDLYSKSGDDYPARVYVMFDYDISRLTWGARWQLKLARFLYGDWVPSAALCYVAANSIDIDTIAPNAYSDRVRMLVVADNGNQNDAAWQSFSRNIANDYQAAFGEPAPLVTGIAIAIDTDDTGETASAWFGDLTIAPIKGY